MRKVSIIWRISGLILIGVILGMVITIKYLVPPTTEISIGKLKLKGDQGTISPSYNIGTEEDLQTRKERREEKKYIRDQERAIKKAKRKRNNDAG